MNDDHWILHRMSQSRDVIRRNLAKTQDRIKAYCLLQADLRRVDVATDLDYQKRYCTFYRMFRQQKPWLVSYFALLQAQKDSAAITFRDVLFALSSDQRVEASFSSKLVATVCPEMPVIDQYVISNLGLRQPSRRGDFSVRLDAWVQLHSDIRDLYESLFSQSLYADISAYFDGWFSGFTGLTEVKKLDILLWQLR